MGVFNSLSAANEAAKYGIFDASIIPATRNDQKLTVNDVRIFATLNNLPKIVSVPVRVPPIRRVPSPRRVPPVRRGPSPRRVPPVRRVPSPRRVPPLRRVPSPRRVPVTPRKAPPRPVAPVRQKITPVPKTTSQKRLSKKAIRELTYKFMKECSVVIDDSERKYLPDPIIGNDYYNLLLDPFNNEKREIVHNKLISTGLYPDLANRLATPCAGKIDFDSYTH